MRIFLFFIVFLTINISSFSKCKYSELIKEAELNIATNDFLNALNKYNQIDKAGHAMFAIDIHNAIVCAIIVNDEKSIKKYGLKLSKIGLPKKYFLKNIAFKKIANEKYWIKLSARSEAVFLKNKKQLEPLKKLVDLFIAKDRYYVSAPPTTSFYFR